MRRRIEITIETSRLVLVSSHTPAGGGNLRWCRTCGAATEQVALDHAALLLRVSPRTIRRWAEAARLHFVESSEGAQHVCLHALDTGPHAEGDRATPSLPSALPPSPPDRDAP
ncbi:MAG: hypothetical protein ACRD9R_00100 [Pyrinomonadaceae bacterium]